MEPSRSSGLVYYRWIYERIEKFIGQKVLVAGPSFDKFAIHLKSKKLIVGLDKNQQAVNHFKNNFSGSLSHHAFQDDLANPENLQLSKHNFDTIICLNALERSASDSVALQHIHKLLIPEGTAIFLVPALPWLSRWLDTRETIRHRYSKKRIFQKLDQHRFHVLHHFYFNSFGILFPAYRTTLEQNTFMDKLAALWNNWEKKFNFPIGRSLVIISKTKLPARG